MTGPSWGSAQEWYVLPLSYLHLGHRTIQSCEGFNSDVTVGIPMGINGLGSRLSPRRRAFLR